LIYEICLLVGKVDNLNDNVKNLYPTQIFFASSDIKRT